MTSATQARVVLREVGELVEARLAAEAAGDAAALDRLLDPVWHAKGPSENMGSIAIVTRAAFLGEVGPASGQPWRLTSVQHCFRDFAVARADHWASAATRFLLVFRTGGTWRIAGEAVSGAEHGVRHADYTVSREQAAALATLGQYYAAVQAGDPQTIANVFDANWHMKNHENGVLVCEDKPAFIRRIAKGPFAGYARDRQIADVQMIADRLCYVRIDRPSRPSTTVFFLFRTTEGWRLIDKAWADGAEGY